MELGCAWFEIHKKKMSFRSHEVAEKSCGSKILRSLAYARDDLFNEALEPLVRGGNVASREAFHL